MRIVDNLLRLSGYAVREELSAGAQAGEVTLEVTAGVEIASGSHGDVTAEVTATSPAR